MGLLLTMLMVTRAKGTTIEELNAKLAGAQAQAQGLNAELERSMIALASARQQAAVAAAREAELTMVLERGRERATQLAAEVEQARSKLLRTQARLERARAALAARLVAIYKSADPDQVGVLLSADGYDDLATRVDLLGRIRDADDALAERVRELEAAVAARLAAVEDAKARADAFNARVERARAEISSARAQAQSRAAALASARSAQAGTLATLQSNMAGWTQEVQRLERISAAEAAQQVAGWSGTGDWAIPEAIVMCESGGNYGAVNSSSGAGGAYQILPSTWQQYGGEGSPHEATPAEQDQIAAQIWADSGPGAWVCAS